MAASNGVMGFVGRGLRNLAKAAIVEYLRLSDQTKGLRRAGAPAAVAPTSEAPRRRRRPESQAAPASSRTEAAEQSQPAARRRSRPAQSAPAAPRPAPAAAAAGAASEPARRRGRPPKQTAEMAAPTKPAPAARAPRAPRTRPAAEEKPSSARAAAPAGRKEAPAARKPAAAAEHPKPAPAPRERPQPTPPAAEQSAPSPRRGANGKLNLNTATRAELLRLPRVGAQTADRIIAFREQNGPIRGIRQLRQADIVSVAIARQIRDLVRF